MPSRVLSAALVGLDAARVEVECDAGTGQFMFVIVGLPDAAVQESRERVRAAIKNSGFSFPRGRVTVNLAPAHIRKEGPAYDLPIAVSILLAGGSAGKADDAVECMFIGELSLDGKVREVSGVLPIALAARDAGCRALFVPKGNAAEASLVLSNEVYAIENLAEVIDHLAGVRKLSAYEASLEPAASESFVLETDFHHIRGHAAAKRALEIAAAGGHNILMAGFPGSGKTLLARSVTGILPPLEFEEALEVTRVYSIAGMVRPGSPLMRERPFRSPHHSASVPSLVGGGSVPRPGEISLAHRGVLFLDEFPEFPRTALEALRQPLEEGVISVARASGSTRFPARCMLIAAQNPCPCGYYGSQTRACICSPASLSRYGKRISGPILDRIDVHIGVPSVEVAELSREAVDEESAAVRQRVTKARARQLSRYAQSGIFANAELSSRQCDVFCALESAARTLLNNAAERMNLSTRAYYRVLKLARTIADLSEKDRIDVSAISEAIMYRQMEH